MADPKRGLQHVRAAQLRARVVRGAIGRLALGTLFLIGALAYPLGPAPWEQSSILWTSILVVLSTLQIGLGLRGFARAWHWRGRTWMALTLTWGALAAILMRALLSRVA